MNDIENVEDLDSLLDSQFNLTDEPEVEETDDVEKEELAEDEELSTEESDTNVEETKVEKEEPESSKKTTETKKPTDEEKKEFSFSKMRQENATLKNQKKELERDSELIKELASSYGYTDVEQFREAVKNAEMEKQAKAKNMDPEVYKKLTKQQEEIDNLKNLRTQEELNNKATMVKNSVDNIVDEYDVSKEEVFQRLEKAGFTVDSLLSLSNPEIAIKGVLVDVIVENSKQKDLKKQELLNNLSDDKHQSQESSDSISLDDLLKQDLEDYKANYL